MLVQLPDPPAKDGFAGKWRKENGTEVMSARELAENYRDSLAGTWTWTQESDLHIPVTGGVGQGIMGHAWQLWP